jgi:hypothetical protein
MPDQAIPLTSIPIGEPNGRDPAFTANEIWALQQMEIEDEELDLQL